MFTFIPAKTGKVSRVLYPKQRTVRERTEPKKHQPSSSRPSTRQNENYDISRMTLPGSYEPTNHPVTHHIWKLEVPVVHVLCHMHILY